MLRQTAAAVFLFTMSLCSCQRGIGDSASGTPAASTFPQTSFVEVAPGVKLEVLEWSTEGVPLVLLAGASHSAHVWGELAPHFTDRFRVIGITRRRVGASDAPTEPFGIDELGQDIVAVLDSFSISTADFIGHSFGGAELSWLALHHPERATKLVYLDGAWDFSRVYYAEGWWDSWPQIPATAADSASPQALAAYFARTWGPLFPLDEIRAIHRFDAGGKLVALDPNVGSMFKDMIGPTLDTLDYTRFRTPILAVRAIPETVTDLFRGYDAYDAANKRLADEAFARWRRFVLGEGDRFVAQVPGVVEVRIPGGHHDIFNMQPERVVPVVREFLLRS